MRSKDRDLCNRMLWRGPSGLLQLVPYYQDLLYMFVKNSTKRAACYTLFENHPKVEKKRCQCNQKADQKADYIKVTMNYISRKLQEDEGGFACRAFLTEGALSIDKLIEERAPP